MSTLSDSASLIRQLLDEASALTRTQFQAKYPHAWLLHESAAKPSPSGGGGRMEIASPATVMTMPGFTSPAAVKPTRASINERPASFTIFPLLKTDRNPFADRILVGRAKNNDVVLNNQSVSKVHAYFISNAGPAQSGAHQLDNKKAGARMQLSAYQTLNPTQVGSVIVVAGAPPVDVPDGAELRFGSVSCRYYESGSLHALLLGR